MAAYKDGLATGSFGVKDFVPTIWTGRILSNLNDKRVLPQLCTREYEGQISSFGDTVKVNGVGRVAVSDYIVNSTTISYETATDSVLTVTVDGAKYYAFKVEDIEKAQSKPEYVNEVTKEAANALSKMTEQYLYLKMIGAAENDTHDEWGQRGGSSTTNGGTTFLNHEDDSLDVHNYIYDGLVDAGVKMDDLLAPDEGRFMIVPSFVHGYLLKDDRFIAAGQDGGNALKKNGKIGTVAGFEIYTMPRGYFKHALVDATEDNYHKAFTDVDGALFATAYGVDSQEGTIVADLSSGGLGGPATGSDDYKCLGGVKGAYAYVEALSKTEKLRLEGSFSDAVRGLLLFGGGQIRPNWLITASVDDPQAADS